MGTQLHRRSVVDRNVVIRRIPVLCLEYHRNFGNCGCFRYKYRTLVVVFVVFTLMPTCLFAPTLTTSN